jgi:excisionase family DNA binding protein
VSDPLTLLAELVAEVRELRARVAELERDRRSAADSRWLSVEQTADYLDTTPKAIRARIGRGRLPVVRDGRRVYVDRQALDATYADKGRMLSPTTQKPPHR